MSDEQLEATTGGENAPARAHEGLRLLDWRPKQQNTLCGFCTVELTCGVIIRDITLHRRGGKSWVCLPGRPILDAAGKRVINHAGHRQYAAIVGWRDHALADRFSRSVIDILLAVHPDALGDVGAVTMSGGASP